MNYEKERKTIIERQAAELTEFDKNYNKAKQSALTPTSNIKQSSPQPVG